MLRTITRASLGAGRNNENAFIRPWPCGKERSRDGGMDVSHGAENQQACDLVYRIKDKQEL